MVRNQIRVAVSMRVGGRRLSRSLLAVALVCLLVVLMLDLRPRGSATPTFGEAAEIDGLLPPFDSDETRYVTRCGPRNAPLRLDPGPGVTIQIGSQVFRNGSFRYMPDVVPGDDFAFTVAEGTVSRSYRVRCLPTDFPRWDFQAIRPVHDDLFVVSVKSRRQAPQWLIVFDTRGVPRWWYRPGHRVLWAQILRDGSIAWARSFGDGYGLRPRMAFEVRTTSGRLLRLVRTRGSIIDGHELRETGDGRFLVDSYVPDTADLRRVGGPRKGAIVAAGVQELDQQGHVEWQWNSRGRVKLGETRLRWWARVLANPRRRLGGLRTFDPVHINAVEPRGRDEVIISARHTDAVYGIDRSSGNIAWKLGGRGRAGGLEVIGDPADKRFGGQHDVRIADDGSLSVYDNGKLRAFRPRVAFYRLELGRNRALFIGQLRDPLVRTSQCCGSARQLSGGGWLVDWGDNPLITGFDSAHRLAFRLRLPVPTFRAIPVPPGAATAADLDRSMERMLAE
jgi:Arylsulfotransferase (ASST)